MNSSCHKQATRWLLPAASRTRAWARALQQLQLQCSLADWLSGSNRPSPATATCQSVMRQDTWRHYVTCVWTSQVRALVIVRFWLLVLDFDFLQASTTLPYISDKQVRQLEVCLLCRRIRQKNNGDTFSLVGAIDFFLRRTAFHYYVFLVLMSCTTILT